jgi:hypothetical protein
MTTPDRKPATDESLLELATRAVGFCTDFRLKAPTQDFAPMITGLLMDGQILHALPGRDDRIRAIKLLGRQYPLYGFVLVADVFVHAFERHPVTGVEHATKQDAFIVHVGSRSLRRVLTLPYRVEAGGLFGRERVATFEPVRDILSEPNLRGFDDPYADVFVSVPMPEGKPS